LSIPLSYRLYRKTTRIPSFFFKEEEGKEKKQKRYKGRKTDSNEA